MNGHVQIVRLLCCFGTNINATVSIQILIFIHVKPYLIYNFKNT